MKHILSITTVLFILLTSSVSWSEEVGYGDLKIGSHKSVVDENCIVIDVSYDYPYWKGDFRCYQLEDINFKISFNNDNKIYLIRMDLKIEIRQKNFEEYVKLENTSYFKIREKLSEQFVMDGIWLVNENLYITSFNKGTIQLVVFNDKSEEVTFLDSVSYYTKQFGKKQLKDLSKSEKIIIIPPKIIPKKDLMDGFN